MTDQPTAGVALKHLELAEQIIAALQESVPAMDSYDEDEIAALETEIATIALPFLRAPASSPAEADDRLAVAVEAALDLAAKAVEDHQREGREWVPGSLWDDITRQAAGRIRAIKPQALALLTKSGEDRE